MCCQIEEVCGGGAKVYGRVYARNTWPVFWSY